ncbi:MAG TPA: hypothetical protein PKD61_05860 [Polyangiaceae bacterium]|nr:hypothetical protein [Polyangiaceae bacterium]
MLNTEPVTHLRGSVARVHHVPVNAGHHAIFEQIADLRATSQYMDGGQAARTLFKRPELSVVLVVLAQGKTLSEHHVDRPVLIQTIEGWLGVCTPDGCVEHVAGGLQLLDRAVVHDVEAISDSAILLTIS